jgi:hypothetical protein
MCRLTLVLSSFAALALAGCAGGNVKSTRDYHAPAAPPVQHPLYDPNMPYGTANATWAAPIYNRQGTIVKPTDPRADYGRQPYETAPWAAGAGSVTAPPGTF